MLEFSLNFEAEEIYIMELSLRDFYYIFKGVR